MNPRPRLPALALAACLLAPALAAAQPSTADGAPALKARTCSVEGLMDSIRRGLHSNSEAYKTYLRTLLRESAVKLPLAELQAAFEREQDPALVEHLAAALVARTERGLEPAAMQAVAKRALDDPNPGLRAATVRALRRTGALEHTGDLYQRLVRDASPEVRMEAATNLVEDNLHVYGGHDGPAADSAVAAAATSSDPKVTAHILGQLMTGEISTGSAHKIEQLLHNDSVEVRAAASAALGGVPAAEAPSARASLVSLYYDESDPTVRKSILQSIARLGYASAVPELQRLRSVDPSLGSEIDSWIQILNKNPQDWGLILREKQKQQAR
jgi:hypothetical protein